MGQFMDLDDDCLLEVLDRLSPHELFKIQRLNSRMKRMAGVKMRTKIRAVSIGNWYPTDCAYHLDDNNYPKLDLRWPRMIVGNVFVVYDASKAPIFFNILTKCSGIKSIDFDTCYFPGYVPMEVVRRCPEIECIKLSCKFDVEKHDWELVFDRVGHRLVHFVSTYVETESQIEFIELLSTKCHNIKHLDWFVSSGPAGDLIDLFRTFQSRDCRIKLNCNIHNQLFDDVIDELDVNFLNWNVLSNRYRRLSKLIVRLHLTYFNLQIAGVHFDGLKMLDLSECRYYDESIVSLLITSRFPALEEFRFNSNTSRNRFNEAVFDALFQKMPQVKKLVILCDETWSFDESLPRAAIHRLKKLETIYLDVASDSQPKVFFLQLEQYVDEISFLKKLIIEAKRCLFDSAVDDVKWMKMKQNWVQVNLVFKKSKDN